MLTSPKNPRVQQIRKLQTSVRTRRQEQRFIAEGIRLAEEVLHAGWQPELLLYTENVNSRGQQVVADFQAKGVEIVRVSSQVMRDASDTHTPQGILLVLNIPEWKLPANLTFVLVLDRVRDPGNFGTILRTALAANVDAVIVPPGNVDAFAPKVVRAGMGAHFRLPIFSMDWETIGKKLAGLAVYLADSSGGDTFFEAEFKNPLMLIIGGEAEGAGGQAARLATQHVHIPMPGRIESLNAAVASAILMFEVVRQRG